MDKKIIIGIDQSYKDFGIVALMGENDVLFARSLKFDSGMNNTEKRNHIYSFLERKYNHLIKITDDITVITERISIRSGKGGLSQSYVKSTSALIGTIIDISTLYNVPVYSVDTRSWKAQVVGTCSRKENRWKIPPEKYPTIEYMRDSGRLKYIVEECNGKSNKGVITVKECHTGHIKKMRVNDNIADAFCIALYGFLPESKQKLQKECF